MTEGLRPELPDKVQCAVCGDEIAPAEAKSVEAQDYVMYFCGLQCYQQWREDQSSDRDRDS